MSDPVKIRRALISVYDKTGIVEFARILHEEFSVEIISTGGTAKVLTDAGIPVTLVEDITGFPEMMDGRVKTLHPKIHAAILADRDNPEHMRQLAEQGIEPIDMVVVNLYPFERTIARPDCTFEEAIEMIDIGGPCLLRAAAKNHKHVLVLHDIRDCQNVLLWIREDALTDDGWDGVRRDYAAMTFRLVAKYNAAIVAYLREKDEPQPCSFRAMFFNGWDVPRYGENPHQSGEVLLGDTDGAQPRPDLFHLERGGYQSEVELSFNNYADASAALELCAELTRASSAGPSGLKPGAPLGVGRALREEPRASARAALRKEQASDTPTAFSEPDPNSPAWLLTWTTYGSWLPGDERGFVSRRPGDSGTHVTSNIPGTPYDSDQRELSEAAKKRMKGSPVTLDQEHAPTIFASFVETATTHHIAIIAVSIMPDHVHLLCQGEQSGSQLLQLFKGAASRRMNRAHALTDAPRWWTKSGLKKYIQKGGDVQSAVQYVCSQKDALCTRSFQDVAPGSTGSLRCAARAEARGSAPASTHAACCFIKHTNACGTAVDADPIEAYRKAYLGDPNAAMGGILAVNFNVNTEFAEAVMETYQRWGKPAGAGGFFVEVWLAPSFDEQAVRIIRGEVQGKPQKRWGKRVRLLDIGDMTIEPDPSEMDFKRIAGGVLMQNRDLVGLNEEQWKVVTERQPTDAELDDLRLAWLICKHTKSNAITICKDGMLLGNGAGQMSRVMSCRIAIWLAKENGHEEQLTGAVAASDAFFPFRDGPDILADGGVIAIIQPGGSKRDQDTIAACNERGLAMIFTGTRHFKH